MYESDIELSSLTGKVITSVKIDRENNFIEFQTDNKEKYRMYHEQDCCELVCINDIIGNIEDIVNTKIIEVLRDSKGSIIEDTDSYLWTNFTIKTDKATVIIIWLGTSNGYYSESVSFDRIE